MTIWILALLLLGCGAGIGYRQGIIRVGFSTLAIPIAAVLSPSLAGVVKPVLSAFGISHPVLVWMIAPIIVFIVILSIFKSAGYAVHHKADVFYRHQAGDLRLALWERLRSRLGMCLGMVNGLMYLVIISWVIYTMGYWTVQLASTDSDPRWMRILNRLSWDLEKTGLTKAAAAVDHTPEIHYEMADLAGLIYQNSLLEARLSRYPAFLWLGERDEFQNIAKDQKLMEQRLQGASVREIMSNGNIDAIIRNPDLLKLIWNMVALDITDLRAFLETGRSPKYDREPLLGRWYYSSKGSIAEYRKEKPNVPTSEVQKLRRWMIERFSKAMIVAAPDRHLVMKDYPRLNTAADVQTLKGQWKGADGDYVLTFEDSSEHAAHVESLKLYFKGESVPVVFDKEE